MNAATTAMVRRYRSRVARRIALLFATISIALGGILASANPASATDYGINVTQACRYTYNNYNVWADYGWYTNPFSWYCQTYSLTISLPPSVTISTLGGV